MTMSKENEPDERVLDPDELGGRERYQLLTSLVVPRPIGWISSRSSAGVLNLAPFSYFAALATSPMLVGFSVGSRRGEPKDTLRNVRESGAFCVNVVTARHLEAMNLTSAEHPPEVDEFEMAGLEAAEAARVAAPYVVGCPAVLECRLHREVDLREAGTVLLIGEVLAVRLSGALSFVGESLIVDPVTLRPVGRLAGDTYSVLDRFLDLPKPG